MPKIDFIGFDWDSGNESKCLKHGVSAAEIESLFESEPRIGPDDRHSLREDRFRAVGMTRDGRSIFVVFTWRRRFDGGLMLRPISARYMHRREIEAYEKSLS